MTEWNQKLHNFSMRGHLEFLPHLKFFFPNIISVICLYLSNISYSVEVKKKKSLKRHIKLWHHFENHFLQTSEIGVGSDILVVRPFCIFFKTVFFDIF
jgi:hypothetical protein